MSLDKNWRYTYVNKRAAEMFGRKAEDLIGKHIWTEFPEGIGQKFYHNYYKAVEEQRPITIEEYYPPWNRWFENDICPTQGGLSIFSKKLRSENGLRNWQTVSIGLKTIYRKLKGYGIS